MALSTKRSSSQHLNLANSEQKEKLVLHSKKANRARSSAKKHRSKDNKVTDQAPGNPRKPPFSCACPDKLRKWGFSKSGHPICKTCNAEPLSTKKISPKSSDSTIYPNVSANGERLSPVQASPPSICTSVLEKAARRPGSQSITFSERLESRIKRDTAQSDASEASASKNSSSINANKSALGAEERVVLRGHSDSLHSNRPVRDHKQIFGSYTANSQTDISKNPFRCSNPKSDVDLTSHSRHSGTVSRRVSFEDSSSSEKVLTPSPGNSTPISGDCSDSESYSSDDSDWSGPSCESDDDGRDYKFTPTRFTPQGTRALVLHDSNPFKRILGSQHSETSTHSASHLDIRTCANGTENAGLSSYRSTTSGRNNNSTGLTSTGTQKRKATAGSSQSDGEDEDESRQRRGNKEPRSSSSSPMKRFACPYFQREQRKSPKATSCFQSGFRSIHYLKEHLYRTHERPWMCPRCFEVVGKDSGRDDHLRACKVVLQADHRPVLEGFDEAQKKKIEDRMRGKKEEEKWRIIYKILFPDDSNNKIPSPYWTDQAVLRKKDALKTISSHEAFIKRKLPSCFQHKFNAMGPENSYRAIVEALEETFSAFWCAEGADLFGDVKDDSTNTTPTPGPSRTSPSFDSTRHLNDALLHQPESNNRISSTESGSPGEIAQTYTAQCSQQSNQNIRPDLDADDGITTRTTMSFRERSPLHPLLNSQIWEKPSEPTNFAAYENNLFDPYLELQDGGGAFILGEFPQDTDFDPSFPLFNHIPTTGLEDGGGTAGAPHAPFRSPEHTGGSSSSQRSR